MTHQYDRLLGAVLTAFFHLPPADDRQGHLLN